jgi:hypothetical protein
MLWKPTVIGAFGSIREMHLRMKISKAFGMMKILRS